MVAMFVKCKSISIKFLSGSDFDFNTIRILPLLEKISAYSIKIIIIIIGFKLF